MSAANPGWGAPRIHGELGKLGIQVSETTVAKWETRMGQRIGPTHLPQRSWRAADLSGVISHMLTTKIRHAKRFASEALRAI